METLLRNCRNQYAFFDNPVITLDQALWLTEEIFKRSLLKEMVCIHPMDGPNDLISVNNKKIPVTSKIHVFKTSIFKQADFDVVRNLYADAMAHELDMVILGNLIKTNKLLSADMLPDPEFAREISIDNDYIIGPKTFIDGLIKINVNIEKYVCPVLLDQDTFLPIVVAGNYPENKSIPSQKDQHVFCPYILFSEQPVSSLLTLSPYMRYGWYQNNTVEKEMEW